MTFLLRAYLRLMSMLCAGKFDYASVRANPARRLLFNLHVQRRHNQFILWRLFWILCGAAACWALFYIMRAPVEYLLLSLFGAVFAYLFAYLRVLMKLRRLSRDGMFQQLLLTPLHVEEYLDAFHSWISFLILEPVILLASLFVVRITLFALYNNIPFSFHDLSILLYGFILFSIFILILVIFYKVGLWGGFHALQNFVDGNTWKSCVANSLRAFGGQLLCLVLSRLCCIILIVGIIYCTRRMDQTNQQRLNELKIYMINRLKLLCFGDEI